jgi:hypothetical protein
MVLLVDDHDGFRQNARALLEADGLEVVGEAADGESAIVEAVGSGRDARCSTSSSRTSTGSSSAPRCWRSDVGGPDR